MKVYFGSFPESEDNHYIYHVIKDVDDPFFTHSVNVPLDVLYIDEIDENRHLMVDLLRCVRKKDADGDPRFFIKTDGTLVEKEGWVEHVVI